MAVIHVLDKHTAELIAAGEVVERPSSVVKELVENAIDAGSTSISVAITRGGIGSIEVSDDGSGIEAEYIATAFIRHATSKIEKEADLTAIGTLGFRGEALASISSVAKVELLTRTEADEFACLYRQQGGEELSREVAARPVGTTITVRDLFFNVPARMKFLKKDTSEGNYVGDVVLRQALAHPEIAFRFVREGKELFHTPGDGETMSAVYEVLSRDFAKDLLPVDHKLGVMRVTGYVTAPIASRGSRSMQFFYVNNRYVADRTLMAALEAAYKGLAMQGRFPGCVLNLTLPLDRVDVNVHPAKTQVRFADTKLVFDAIYQAVRAAVTKPDAPQKTLHFDNVTLTSPPAAQTVTPQKPMQATPANYVPLQKVVQIEMPGATPQVIAPPLAEEPVAGPAILRQESAVPYYTQSDLAALDIEKTQREAPASWQQPAPAKPAATAAFDATSNTALQQDAQPETIAEEPQEPLCYVGEAFRTYILAQYHDELILIDKHAAHERILYEKLLAGYGKVDGQLLMTPVSVVLSAAEKNALLADETLLADAGFEVEDFGGSSVLVRAVPANVPAESVERLTEEIAAKLAVNAHDTLSEKTDWVLHSIACRAAIKAGDQNPAQTLLSLAKDILDGVVPPFCPHGRPVLIHLSQKELEKQFGRRE